MAVVCNKPKVKISQTNRFKKAHGFSLRSSGIFYYRYDKDFKTTLSLLNYWKIKRNTNVSIVANLRHMNGGLIKRQVLDFSKGEVINYSPNPFELCDTIQGCFEGSLEIEIFSLENMVIPFAAIIAVYESKDAVSQVHTYGRTYSQHEIEEKNTLTQGEESCWTLRDNNQVQSFCVIHNGGHKKEAQKLTLTVKNPKGNQKREEQFLLESLAPYQSVMIYPGDYINDLEGFVNGKWASASLSFELEDAFTRMLVGNMSKDASDFQITHSNFNYSKHETEKLQDVDATAHMLIPSLDEEIQRTLIVYPDSDPGAYHLKGGAVDQEFVTGQTVICPIQSGSQHLEFVRKDGFLPARIVTALACSKNANLLPAECSLGVMHHKRPSKRLWWGICGKNTKLSSRIIAFAAEYIYGKLSSKECFVVRLYSAFCHDFKEKSYPASSLKEFEKGLFIHEIFPDAEEFLKGEFGYFTFFCEYGGMSVYQSLEKVNGSMTLEHGF